jgi:transposase-like protein
MDPTTTFCPNRHCPARGQTGQGNIGIHARKEQRFICHACHKTFSARTGTVFYRLRTSAETVVIVVTLLAHGCPVQAIVAAFGFDERTIADWWTRSGQQGQAVHAYLVEQPRALGQVQADELRVKKQGGIVWMALAMMVQTRLWLGGVVSEQRDPSSPVGLYRWFGVLHPGHSRDLSRSRTHGPGRTATAPSVAPCFHRSGRQALRAAAGGRDRAPHCGRHAGTGGDAATPLARRRDDQHRLHRTAERDVPGTPRTAGAPVPGVGTPHPNAARGDVRGGHGL